MTIGYLSPVEAAEIDLEHIKRIVSRMNDSDKAHLALHLETGLSKTASLEAAAPRQRITPKLLRENARALLIGVGRFKDPLVAQPTFPEEAAEQDVLQIRRTLVERCGYLEHNITMLLHEEATMGNIRQALSEVRDNALSCDGFEQVLVYLSSHGRTLHKGNLVDGQEPCFCIIAHDTEASEIFDTAMSADKIFQRISEILATHKIVIVDACYSGQLNGKPGLRRGDEVYMLSCNHTEKSYVLLEQRISVFTKCLVDALDGHADNDQDGKIYLPDLQRYLTANVSKLAESQGKQNPQFLVRLGDPNILLAQL